LGVIIKKAGSECNRCGALEKDVGPISDYKKHGYDMLLCRDCISQIEEYANLRCPKCNKKVGHDGMTEYDGQRMCYKCEDKRKNVGKISNERIQFIKKYWYAWIMIAIGILGVIIAG